MALPSQVTNAAIANLLGGMRFNAQGNSEEIPDPPMTPVQAAAVQSLGGTASTPGPVSSQKSDADYGVRPISDAGGLMAATPKQVSGTEQLFAPSEAGAETAKSWTYEPPTDEVAPSPNPALQLTAPMGMAAQVEPMRSWKSHYDYSRVPFDEELRTDIEKSPEELAKHQENITKAEMATQKIMADGMMHLADQSDQANKRMQAEQAKRDAQIDQQIQLRDSLSHKQAEMNPDGSRFWKNPGSILMAIGAVIRPGNAGMDFLEKAIDRDIAEQKTAFDQAGEKVRQQDLLINQYSKTFSDRNQRDAALEAQAYENAARRVDAFAAQSKNKEIEARGAMMAEALRQKAFEPRMLFQKLAFVPAGSSGGAGTVSKGTNVFMSTDGKRYEAKGEPSRKILAASAVGKANIDSAIDSYNAALAKLGAEDIAAAKAGIVTSAMSEAKTAYQRAQVPIREMGNEGVWKKSETDMLADSLTPPDHITGDPQRQGNFIKQQVGVFHNNLMKVEDAIPISETIGHDAKGELATKVRLTGKLQEPLKLGMPSGFKAR